MVVEWLDLEGTLPFTGGAQYLGSWVLLAVLAESKLELDKVNI